MALPRPLALATRLARRLPYVLSVMGLLHGPRSRADLLRVKARLHPPTEPVDGVPGGAVPLAVEALGGERVFVRPRTSDSVVLAETFLDGYSRPPEEIAGRDLRRIVELGTNIGIGLAGLAVRYPRAALLGVEADSENAAMARRNLAPWSDRVTIVEAAVWDEDGKVELVRDGRHASGIETRPASPSAFVAGAVRAVTPATLLEKFHPGEPIDYLYLDIEGSHERLLRGDPGWLDRVQAIKVSAHHGTDFGEEDCACVLHALGFRTRVIETGATGWTVGIRG